MGATGKSGSLVLNLVCNIAESSKSVDCSNQIGQTDRSAQILWILKSLQ